eukprot:4499085-Pleurochrysis_carterae.AAC.1
MPSVANALAGTAPMPAVAVTMASVLRVDSLRAIIQQVSRQNVPGSYLEAGVWRGGMSILATAAMQLYGLGDRPIYLCDSFQGLPLPRSGSVRPDEAFYANELNASLAVGMGIVQANFDTYAVPRDNVRFVPGYFVDSLPPLRKALHARNEELSILRLDGDM